MKSIFALLLGLGMAWTAQAQLVEEVPRHGFGPSELQWMSEQNGLLQHFYESAPSLYAEAMDPTTLDLLQSTQATPFAEYQETGYLILSDGFHFQSQVAKMRMAEHLPEGVDLVVYTDSSLSEDVERLRSIYHQFLAPERVKIVYLPNSRRGFWTRDGIPVPVFRWASSSPESQFSLVDARYYHGFEPDEKIKELFYAQLTRHNFYFEGGNFVANTQNECLIINSKATQKIPDAVFKDHYGCQKLVRLEHLRGIGHADEVVKFINDRLVLTDDERYVPVLENAGYQVVMLPRAQNRYETYVNSLIVNGTVYVPVFGHATDAQALQVYRDLGLVAYGLPSSDLSNNGMGSIHCITMTYPPVALNELLKALGGSLLP